MKGFTLPEALITLAVSIIAGSLLISILIQNNGLFFQQTSRVEQGLGLNDALSKIRSDIKQAVAVADNYTDGSTTYTTDVDQLVLKIQALDSSGSVIFNVYDYIVYFLDNGNLKVKIFPGAGSSRSSDDKIIAFNVSTVNFEYFDINGVTTPAISAVRVKLTLTLTEKAGQADETNTLTTEARLRNI